ncbi:hypothetical protein [Rhodobacter ferrooxidans]|uniref:Uncharacterized protein n=1 Tax=Rhodobacter ferrooxidans TaxID=371731 RepID=C8S3Z6_9RHOB|nr:hypothetical protein [Rhodobacter sp. SW2]EEW24258.1 hypothetical protein Rsw2DRAFT_2774 [Rhodobacter sp. SW2]
MKDDWLVELLTELEAHASKNGHSHLYPILEKAFEAAARELKTTKPIPGRILPFCRSEPKTADQSDRQPTGDLVAFQQR